ncbi:MAG: type IX secretion system sortase PorU [Bacteroidales bacterium]|nr:type IX secretion system sortase PorU [Bacteroidales bacterium]
MFKYLKILLVLFSPVYVFASYEIKNHITLDWQAPDTLHYNGLDVIARLYFTDAIFNDSKAGIPYYSGNEAIHDKHVVWSATMNNILTVAANTNESKLVNRDFLDTSFTITQNVLTSRGNFYLQTQICGLRINPKTGAIEKLLSFDLISTIEDQTGDQKSLSKGFANSSILATGNWYRMRLKENGIYKITGNELKNMGVNLTGLNPANIRLFGNGGGLLPVLNSIPRPDDLAELPIQIFDGGDASFDATDYFLFYGKGPVNWSYNQLDETYSHQNHYYDDFAYVFLTVDLGTGKRIETNPSETGTVLATITKFPDYQVIDEDIYNLTNTGRTWYGDQYDVTLSKSYQFAFPNLNADMPGTVNCFVAGRTMSSANFQLKIDGQPVTTIPIQITSTSSYTYATTADTKMSFNPAGSNLEVGLVFSRSSNTSRGWLDFIEVNVWRNLMFSGNQISFRNPVTSHQTGVYEYRLSNANEQIKIWDVTDPVAPFIQNAGYQSNTLTFNASSLKSHEFLAYDGSSFKAVEFIEKVDNQNLHAVKDIDYLIVSHPDFLEEAERLAEIHRNNSNLTVAVTTPQKIYNEFSSGAQDITAIRDFARKLYTQSTPGRELRYLMLFGDGSFDYKDRIGGNSNFVPTWESIASLDLIGSIASDDYFGFMDENEDDTGKNLVDIGIGRFPVGNILQARQMVDKVESYLQKKEGIMGPWRNFVTFIADDGNGNLHLHDAETLAALLESTQKAINIDKIYLDSFKQIATTGGQKAPEMNQAINNRIEKGSLMINYTGHGGEIGWGHERILEIADIINWRNSEMLPVFITATCEFARYDDPTRVSAGELVILNPDGGAISMFTTSRATYSTSNLRLNKAIYENNIFQKQNGEYPRFGDVIRISKINGESNDLKFVLLGDPGLQLAYPTLKVLTTHINDIPVSESYDTLRGYDIVKVSGIIADEFNQIIPDYNGIVYPSVYDKSIDFLTYGDENAPTTYALRNSLIYKGKVAVTDGKFTFSFMLPKDIAYKYGIGRISYYATDYVTDANGYFENIVIGGFNDKVAEDEKGPVIDLYLNDTTFMPGNMTNENPTLLAHLKDENGINTTGNGIGHDIVATISGATDKTMVLNDFYEADLNKSTSGIVNYLFSNLNPGKHTLSLKAWDVFNNSSEKSIEFNVIGGEQMAMDNLYNYPNPFINETSIVFDHNQTGNDLDVEVSIFNSTGQLVKTISRHISGNGIQSEPIKWDGTSDGGFAVPKGLYIYRVFVTNEKGESSDKRAKMLFFR